MPVSSIPAVLTALVAAARAAMPGVDVHDGPTTGNIENSALIIGSATDQGVAATDDRSTVAPSYGNPLQRVESYDIPCLASVYSGDSDDASMVTQRAACFAIVDAVDALLSADKTLGGVVMSARVSRVEAYQVIGDTAQADDTNEPEGRTAAALFTVQISNHLH